LQQELEKGRILIVEYDKDLGYPKSAGISFSDGLHAWGSIFVEKLKIIGEKKG
jgi:hypothetical protein